LAILRGDDENHDTKKEKITTKRRGRGREVAGAFQPYEKGCRGTVCLLCTDPGVKSIVSNVDDVGVVDDENDATGRMDGNNPKLREGETKPHHGDEDDEGDREESPDRDREDTGKRSSSNAKNKRMKHNNNDDDDGDDMGKVMTPSTTTTMTAPTSTTCATETKTPTAVSWDPLRTVYAIARSWRMASGSSMEGSSISRDDDDGTDDHDDDTNVEPDRHRLASAPRSRYITRMIPLQSTCLASPRLDRRYQDHGPGPHEAQIAIHPPDSDTTTSTTKFGDGEKEEGKGSSSWKTQRPTSTTGNDRNTTATTTTTTTFAVHVKIRNCERFKGSGVFIDAAAGQVAEATNDDADAPHPPTSATATALAAKEQEQQQQEQHQRHNKQWTVDLSDPDYTIWIEICKNLCGVSIVSRRDLKMMPNFNLSEIAAESSVSYG